MLLLLQESAMAFWCKKQNQKTKKQKTKNQQTNKIPTNQIKKKNNKTQILEKRAKIQILWKNKKKWEDMDINPQLCQGR